MELTREVQRKLALKLQQSRLRLLGSKPFYGLLLLNVKFSLDIAAETAYADGERIAFSPGFLDGLTGSEVDFVLMHEILHTALAHTNRSENYDQKIFNIAADIVVNSNILHSCGGDIKSITLRKTGECMHNLPDGREGYNFSVEELYPIVQKLMASKKKLQYKELTSRKQWDNHTKWKPGEESNNQQGAEGPEINLKDGSEQLAPGEMKDLWLQRMVEATDLINSMAVNGGLDYQAGSIPAFMERILKELRESKLDWRTILQNFVQEDITDYSFTPPDRRFEGGPFFLPDLNEKESSVKNVLFMVDASGSMGDKDISDAFSEVKGAVDQFGGKLAGWLGFFDAKVYDPIPFESAGELLKIKPKGGGGTSFKIIFDYVKNEMPEAPACIVILTDGFADIPKEEAAGGIPVLWLINNGKITPGWGKVARINP